jgi:uncharacterized OB-fold protein
MSKPVPQPTEISTPYWGALSEGVLSIQRCTGCGAHRHYPRELCDKCYSMEFEWVTTSGRGTLHSWTVAHHAFHAGFADELPYIVAIVDLEEGVRAMGRLRNVPAREIRIGLPVQFVAEEREDGVTLPAFIPAPDQAAEK